MPTVVNNNLKMIDRPIWEQLNSALANTAAGSCLADDNERFIYLLLSATSFWRYDTWADTWQQLANPTGGTVGTGTTMRFVKQIGGQFNNVVYGSVFAFISNGVAAPVFNKYDIATNTWSALSVASIPATFGTDAKFMCPEPFCNGYIGGYHSGVLQTITASGAASAGATSITVTALTNALPNGAVLNFGTLTSPKWAVLTAAAAASATTLTVAALISGLTGTETALFYDHAYLIGNAATQMYRYQFSTNAWATTSANGGNPALPAITGAPGFGCTLKWLPGSNEVNANNILKCVRGGATANIYSYRLDTNAWSTDTFHPTSETFTTGTSYGVRSNSSGQQTKLLISKEVTNRIYEYDPLLKRLDPKATQWLLTQGVALVGDKSCVLKSPEGIEFFYLLLSTSASFVRTPLFF